MGGLGVSRLGNNLVISYWLPGDDDHSGLSLIGTDRVDESICTLFDYLRDKGEKPQLVNVPDFVVNSLRYPEMFHFETGRGDDEYLLKLSRFASLENMPQYMRIRARKFMRHFLGQSVQVEPINMKSLASRQMLIEKDAEWPRKGINDINKLEREVLPIAVSYAPKLGIEGVGLFIAGELQAYCLYFSTNDKDYTIISHARVNYDLPRIFDYIVHVFCQYLTDQGFAYINIHADNGSQKMRALKIALKPDGFFHKYTIGPKS